MKFGEKIKTLVEKLKLWSSIWLNEETAKMFALSSHKLVKY